MVFFFFLLIFLSHFPFIFFCPLLICLTLCIIILNNVIFIYDLNSSYFFAFRLQIIKLFSSSNVKSYKFRQEFHSFIHSFLLLVFLVYTFGFPILFYFFFISSAIFCEVFLIHLLLVNNFNWDMHAKKNYNNISNK